jgi:hypothetical protein
MEYNHASLDIPLDQIGFNVRTLNAIRYYNKTDRFQLGAIEKLGDFKFYRRHHFRNFRYIGESSLKHLIDVLAKYHIQLPD